MCHSRRTNQWLEIRQASVSPQCFSRNRPIAPRSTEQSIVTLSRSGPQKTGIEASCLATVAGRRDSRLSHPAAPKFHSQVPRTLARASAELSLGPQSNHRDFSWSPQPSLRVPAHHAQLCELRSASHLPWRAVPGDARRPSLPVVSPCPFILNRRLHRCGCATSPWARGSVDQDAEHDVRQYSTLHRTEQPQLNPPSTAENEYRCGSARRYCTDRASRPQRAINGSS